MIKPDSAGIDTRPSAVIYTHSLLEGSNTFIKSHAEALTRYCAVYAGSRRVDGIELPPDRTYVVNRQPPFGLAKEAMFRKFGWAPTLVNQLRTHEPKVVHAHFGTSGPAAMALADALGVPFIVTFHGADATLRTDNRKLSHREREFLGKKDEIIDRASAFIAVSGYIRERLLEQGFPEEKLILHRNGIDIRYFSPGSESKKENVVVFVGRFVEKKGAGYLIEAARLLHAAGVDLKLVMIGSGPLEASIKEQAIATGVTCLFPGFLPIDAVKDWLSKATVVAVPSVTAADGDSEGLPTILLEAQSMETPVVATRHSGIPEGVSEGVTAELVDERDPMALAEKLRSFLLSPEKARRYGSAARQFVAEKFDLRLQVGGLEQIYDSVIEHHSD